MAQVGICQAGAALPGVHLIQCAIPKTDTCKETTSTVTATCQRMPTHHTSPPPCHLGSLPTPSPLGLSIQPFAKSPLQAVHDRHLVALQPTSRPSTIAQEHPVRSEISPIVPTFLLTVCLAIGHAQLANPTSPP